jgi:hypothetical protein
MFGSQSILPVELLITQHLLVFDNIMLSRNEVETKHLRFLVAEFILNPIEGLLRMTHHLSRNFPNAMKEVLGKDVDLQFVTSPLMPSAG